MKVKIELNKTKEVESIRSENWGMSLLARLLTELCNNNKTGSIYAEHPADEEFFKITDTKERMLHKGLRSRIVAPEQGKCINRFIGFLNKEVFKVSPSSMLAGILEIQFTDEKAPRYFSVYSRRSGSLGDFLQIDQFSKHL